MGATPEGEICKRGQALSMKQALSKMVELMAKDPAHREDLASPTATAWSGPSSSKEMALKSCSFGEILICETGGISTVYANDGGIVAAY